MTNKNNSTNTNLISFIVCCYNVAAYLDDFINSLIKQTYVLNNQKFSVENSKDIQIILVEDCSTDNGKTIKKCELLSKKYSNINLVRNKKNLGLSKSRNNGIKASTGKYISFPDPDDLLNKDTISKYVEAISANSVDVVCLGLIEKHISNEKLINEHDIIPNKAYISGAQNIARATINMENNVYFGYAWNKIYKKSIIDKYSFKFNPEIELVEDIIFNIEFFKKCNNISIVDYPGIIYFRRGNSVSTKFYPKYFELHYLRIESLMNYWADNNVLDNQAKKVLAKFYFRYAISTIWRNSTKESKMSINEQKKWFYNFYKLELTSKLLPYANSNSKATKILLSMFKHKRIKLLIFNAHIINFVTKTMGGFLIKLRQKR